MNVKNIVKQLLTRIFSENVIVFKRREKDRIFLTFDDGPNPEFTPKILDILKAHCIKAEFYLIGTQVQRHPDIVRRIIAEGHVIGSHSFSHKGFGRMGWANQKEEIVRGAQAVKPFAPEQELLFRPPQGRLNLKQILFCRERKIKIMMWTVDSMDYDRTKNKDAILERLKNIRFNGGEIILFHDDNHVTVDALGDCIHWIKSKNLKFAV